MRTTINDGDLFYASSGSGIPIVLIHGFPLNHSIWIPQVQELSQDFQAITPDLRGHGESQATSGIYTMDLLSQDVKALIDRLGFDRIVLGGHSMGGYVAFSFFRQFRNQVQALILADTKAEADTSEARVRREQQAQEALSQGTKPLADRLILTMLTSETRANNPALTNQVYEMMRATSPVGIAAALRGMAHRPDSTPLLGSIDVPTLIIVGEKDQTTPVNDSQRMAAGISGSDLVVIPGAAHLTSLEKPNEVNAAVIGFLKRIKPLLTV